MSRNKRKQKNLLCSTKNKVFFPLTQNCVSNSPLSLRVSVRLERILYYNTLKADLGVTTRKNAMKSQVRLWLEMKSLITKF